jgi:hypothetical protein
MILYSNQAELKQFDPELFSNIIIISTEAKKITMFDFINKIMSTIYRMIFNNGFPRVSEEIKNKLKFNSNDMIGDWFLYRYYTIIKVYGFHEVPYILRAFLTPRVFSLEFVRKKAYLRNVAPHLVQ